MKMKCLSLSFSAQVRGDISSSQTLTHYLIAAVKTLSSHKPLFTPNVSEALQQSFTARSRHDGTALTARERQVVQLIAEGHTNKATGKILNNSLKTVETHRAKVIRKLDLSSTAALVRYAIRNKLIDQ